MESAAKAKGEEELVTATIYVRPSTYRRLLARKDRGISFDDVITDLLDDADESQAEDTKA